VWFRQSDYLPDHTGGPKAVSLDQAVRDLVESRTGARPRGPIRLLTHLRFFGYSFNPVSFYYVFDESDSRVETIVAEITNTPWKERHAYVLPVNSASRASARAWQFSFGKQFHVSPFMPMEQHYEWSFGIPGEGLHVHMENYPDGTGSAAKGDPVFDATLNLKRREITGASLAGSLLRFPLSSLRVVALIHWQALKLVLKRTPFFPHPKLTPPAHGHTVPHAPVKL
jgi:DUF1365 family protein